MRKDFDYVDFIDYSHDMNELSSYSSSIIQELSRQLKQAHMLCWSLIWYSPNHTIEIPCPHLFRRWDKDGFIVQNERIEINDSVRFTVKKKDVEPKREPSA